MVTWYTYVPLSSRRAQRSTAKATQGPRKIIKGTLARGPDLKENGSPTQGPNNAQKTQGRKGTLGEARPPNPKITKAPFEKGTDLV